ncbi:UNVERIFIED_CONTAM: hypothetical protein FKN15_028279 [Acipenser sinensis]
MAAGSQVSPVNSGLMKICTAAEVKNETQLMMKSYANWEEFLMPGPTSVAILSELIFISAADDFPLNRDTPDKKLKFVKHPESFRACLMQVCNQGWRAFNTAHKNMDQIRLYSLNIPNDIKMVVQTLMQEDTRIVETLLPPQLNKIDRVAKNCLKLANSVEESYLGVIELIGEILEVATAAKSSYTESLKEAERAIEEAQIRKKSAEKAKELSEKHFKEMQEQMKENKEAYKEAMSSLPGGWAMIGLALAESFKDSIKCIPEAIKNLSQNPLARSYPEAVGAVDCDDEKRKDDLGATNNILTKSNQLLQAANSLTVFVSDEEINMKELRDQKTKKAKSEFSKKIFTRIKQEVEREKKCAARKAVLKICEGGISICKDLEKIVGSPNHQLEEKLPSKIKEFFVKVLELHSSSNRLTHTSTFQCKSPHATKASNKLSPPSSVLETTINMAQYNVEQAKSELKNVREEHNRSFENMKQCDKELDEILIMMKKCDAKQIDFDTTLKILVQGLKALGRVKEQWTKMVNFFQMMSNLINTHLSEKLTQFVEECKDIPSIPGYSHSSFIKDMIYNQAFQANNIANLVHMISETYVDVSRKHLMDRVSSLGTLVSLEASDPQFNSIRSEIQSNCADAKAAIQDLVNESKEAFEERIQQRIDKINTDLKAVLPAASGEQMQAIQSSVRKDPMLIIEELSEEDTDQYV